MELVKFSKNDYDIGDVLPKKSEITSLKNGDTVQLGYQDGSGTTFFWAAISDIPQEGKFKGFIWDGLSSLNGSAIEFEADNIFEIL